MFGPEQEDQLAITPAAASSQPVSSPPSACVVLCGAAASHHCDGLTGQSAPTAIIAVHITQYNVLSTQYTVQL